MRQDPNGPCRCFLDLLLEAEPFFDFCVGVCRKQDQSLNFTTTISFVITIDPSAG